MDNVFSKSTKEILAADSLLEINATPREIRRAFREYIVAAEKQRRALIALERDLEKLEEN